MRVSHLGMPEGCKVTLALNQAKQITLHSNSKHYLRAYTITSGKKLFILFAKQPMGDQLPTIIPIELKKNSSVHKSLSFSTVVYRYRFVHVSLRIYAMTVKNGREKVQA